MNILMLIGGGVCRKPGYVDEIEGTQSAVRVLATAQTLEHDPHQFDLIVLSGGIACGAPYQTQPESLLMFRLLLVELAERGIHLPYERFLFDSWALNSAQNLVHALTMIPQRVVEHRCSGNCTPLLPEFRVNGEETIRRSVMKGVKDVSTMTFVTFGEHHTRLEHILRHGLLIDHDDLPVTGHIDTPTDCQPILEGNRRSMEAAKLDPLGIGPESLQHLHLRSTRAREVAPQTCWHPEYWTAYTCYLTALG